jgi:predicted transcriptional regulator
VVNTQTGQPAGIITAADIDRAIADGKDVNDVRVQAVMTARWTVNANYKDPRDAQRDRRPAGHGYSAAGLR